MKNLNRAYNRHKAETKFKNRVKKWMSSHWGNSIEETQIALDGKGYTFLRSTGRPCSCYGCSQYKYERTPKYKVIKESLE